MSADRGNAKVSYLYKAYQPAVLRMIKFICESAHKAGIPVGMCGEAAADTILTPVSYTHLTKEKRYAAGGKIQ